MRFVGPRVEVEAPWDLEAALRRLKKLVDREGIRAAVRRHKHHEKPGDRKRHKHHEAVRKLKRRLAKRETAREEAA